MKFLKVFVVLAVSLMLFGCKNDDSFKYPKSKIWAHRVNNPEDANKKIGVFDGIEIDLVLDTVSGNVLVSHEIDNHNKLTFREFLRKIKKTGKTYYWLDVKNLYDDVDAICDTIIVLADEFGFRNHFFVESWHSWSLKIAKEKGLRTSLWVTNIFDSQEHDTLRWKSNVEKAITVCNPDALSAEYRMRKLLDEYFPENNIHLWQTPAAYNDENVKITREICLDPHVKVLLVDYDKPIAY